MPRFPGNVHQFRKPDSGPVDMPTFSVTVAITGDKCQVISDPPLPLSHAVLVLTEGIKAAIVQANAQAGKGVELKKEADLWMPPPSKILTPQ